MKVKRLSALSLLALTAAIALAACDTGPATPASQNLPTPIASIRSTAGAGAGGPSTSVMTPTSTSAASTTEQPVAPEQNPLGDIPDTQAFVKYISAAGAYELDAPEGWARTESGTGVSFIDKLDGVLVTITDAAAPPTIDSVRANELAATQKSGRAVQVASVKAVTLPGGPAILVDYTSNSEPNPVTGKQVRLENNAYLLYKENSAGHGKLSTITLWAPVGADNVDQWQRMSQSFRWR